ncbi:MAG: IS3 family transposase [Fuerstia sp.]|nr:IS3 family transposase [Fuerstiella sp.]
MRRNLRKRRATGESANACHVQRAESRNDVWCWDFAFDRTQNGSTLKWLSIIDEHTRECLALEVGRGITSENIIDTLAALFAIHGVPRAIRSDNGPEFVSKTIQSWLARLQIRTLYISPGSPWENGYAESFHSRLRDEFLKMEIFENLSAARQQTRAWSLDYNQHRPHSSLGYLTPSEFATRCIAFVPEKTSAAPQSSPALQQHSGLTQPLLS